MDEENTVEETPRADLRVGERLREARKEKGLKIEQVAAESRIPQRHLVTIEEGEWHQLPSRTYAIGFTRTYARMLGLPEGEILDQVRAELAEDDPNARAAPAKFEPGDPARVPSRGLAWFSALAVVLLLVGGYSFYRSYFAPGMGPAPLTEEREQVAQAEAPSTTVAEEQTPSGPVIFTNEMEGTWVRFYEEGGEVLFEGQMAEGDTYQIPSDATNPQVRTGRPYALAITIGGRSVPKLSEEDEVISDVPVSADALTSRTAEADGSATAEQGAG